MNDDGDTKDDVRMPDGEVGEKITRLFKTEEKDTSKLFLLTLIPRSASKQLRVVASARWFLPKKRKIWG